MVFCEAYLTDGNLLRCYDFDGLHSDELIILSKEFTFLIQVDWDGYVLESEFVLLQ